MRCQIEAVSGPEPDLRREEVNREVDDENNH